LGLEILERFGRAKLRIIFGHNQQPRERRAQLSLGLLEFFQLGGVRRRLAGIEFHLADAGPRVRHFCQGRLFEIGRARHRADQVRNQIGPSLIDRLHVGPLLIHRLLESHELVVTPAAGKAKQQDKEQRSGESAHKISHK
jgi:hypothetical protein